MRRPLAPFHSVAFLALASLPFLALAQAPAEPAKPAEAPKPPLFSIYGTLDANVQYTTASGATTAAQDVAGRAAVSFDSSNIGIRGVLQVNEYAGATYQCETAASADGIAGAVLCNRNSRVGLTGNWGTLWYGNWDTPFKAAIYGTKADDPFNKTDVYGFQGIMGSPGFNYRSGSYSLAADTVTKGFDLRAQNSVGYHSPKFYGVSLKLQYTVNEFMNATATQDPSLYGAVLNWDYGPFSILAAYEQHNDGWGLAGINAGTAAAPLAFGATVANNVTTAGHSSDSAWRVGAGYQLDWMAGATTLSALYDQLTFKQDKALAGMVKQYKRAAWHVALKHRIAEHEIRARYSMANDGDVTLVSGGGSTTDYGASMLALGYAYYFAPSFNVYLHYAQITNKDNAQYTLTIGGSPAVAGATPRGADPMAVGLGFRYTF
ncbi:MAG TPA: porin [Anaeromyxobacteraceae bacterium]